MQNEISNTQWFSWTISSINGHEEHMMCSNQDKVIWNAFETSVKFTEASAMCHSLTENKLKAKY